MATDSRTVPKEGEHVAATRRQAHGGRGSKTNARIDYKSVFLNVPFDQEYRPLFAALILGLTAMGLKPRCVLEVPSSGKNRLERIHDLMASCGASIHDLSRVAVSGPMGVPRFNMPFELGIAYSLSRTAEHRFFVFEERAYRIQQSLSDLNGIDPMIHRGSVTGLLSCLLDSFGLRRAPGVRELQRLTDGLQEVIAEIQADHGLSDPFSPAVFRQAVETAFRLVSRRGDQGRKS